MPKIISIILAVALLLGSGACLQSFAAEEDFDAVIRENYSPMIQSLLYGEEVEFNYNGKPMSYDLATIAASIEAQQNGLTNGGDASVKFDSARNTYPTHQRICADALAILLHDKGSSRFDNSYYFRDDTNDITCETYADFIVYHSGSPDEDETGTYDRTDPTTGRTVYVDAKESINLGGMTYSFVMFNGHFYDPYTEKNWLDSTADTCKTNARRHYDAAVNLYRAGKYADAFEELGRGCHYVQDACQTQHANNLTAKDDAAGLEGYYLGYTGNNRHATFEKELDEYIRNHMPYSAKLSDTQNNVFDNSIYNEAKKLSVENIVRNNDYSSYVLLDKSDYRYANGTRTEYYDSAVAQYKNATMASVQYFYSFANEVGMSFS